MEQVTLPTKTKIAAGGLIMIGLVIGIMSIWDSLVGSLSCPGGDPTCSVIKLPLMFSLVMFLIGVLFIVAGIFLFKRKKIGWWIGEIILSIPAIGFFGVGISPMVSFVPGSGISLVLLGIIPILLFALLLLDRKNFWKIAT